MSERHMFVNYDDDTLTIQITAYENVAIYEMEPTGQAIESLDHTEYVPQNESSVTFNMAIPAGTIWGFRVASTPNYTNPDTQHLTIVTASDKDPWPTPPPPPPTAYDTEDYEDRAADFLIALSGDRRPQQGRRAEPTEPAEPAPTSTP